MIFESVNSWKLMLLWLGWSTEFCYFLSPGNVFLASKRFCLFSLQCRFDFVAADEFLEIFFAFKSCNWFVLKKCFSYSLTDNIFHFFRIILLMFGKYRLYVIAKGMRELIGVPFLLPFISLFLSKFWTVLMCLSNSSELYPCPRNCSLSSLQWCSKSCDVVQTRLILSA